MVQIGWKSATTLMLASVLLAGSSMGIAQIYKYEDDNGNPIFSDRKPSDNKAGKDVEEVRLQRTNTTPAPNPRTVDAEPSIISEGESIVYHTVITQPTSGSTIPMGPGDFPVTARAEPPLGAGEMLRLTLDGTAVGSPQRSGVWELNNVFRGEHTLVVERLDKNLSPLHKSAAVTVYVLRPSVRR